MREVSGPLGAQGSSTSLSPSERKLPPMEKGKRMADGHGHGDNNKPPNIWALISDYRECGTPFLDRGVDGASRWFATCDTIKKLEKAGKSKLIDSFTATHGLPLGAHRAYDKMHDPLLGFSYAVKEMGWREAAAKWPRHMASDVLTARSLPLPFTHLMKTDSWIVQMYAKGIVNIRTAVVTPAIGVAITEATVRARLRGLDGETEKDKVLQDEHIKSAVVSALSASAMVLLLSDPPVALVFALFAAAVWSAAAGGAYVAKRHKEEISSGVRATRHKVATGAAVAATAAKELPARLRRPEAVSAEGQVVAVRATPTPSDRVTLGVAALLTVAVIATAC